MNLVGSGTRRGSGSAVEARKKINGGVGCRLTVAGKDEGREGLEGCPERRRIGGGGDWGGGSVPVVGGEVGAGGRGAAVVRRRRFSSPSSPTSKAAFFLPNVRASID